ncbi:MAG: aminotransferase class I/II-fold pyridoxal phosphate-dependent enzyme [Gammaproteobacteria bacterium]|nr:MAG: aminotransferase class I/II-fold pyridoxal phosphate-dependent enzyme [Gammaproteobacteria bacterium]
MTVSDKMNMLMMGRSCVYLDLDNGVESAMIDCIRSGEYRGYGPFTGLPELHELIKEDLRIDTPSEVCVTDGAVQALHHVIGWFSRQGSKYTFLDSDPAWIHSRNFARDMKTKLVPGKITPADISEGCVVNLCSPQNPAGHVYTSEEKSQLSEQCRQVGAWLLCDDAYVMYEPEYGSDWTHVYNQNPERTIVAWSASKIGLAGVRVGAFVCHPDLMESLVFGRANALGSSILGQRAAIAALKSKDKWLSALRSQVQENIQYLVGRLGPLGVTITGHSNSVNVSLPAHRRAVDIAAQLEVRRFEVADGTKFYGMEGYDANYLRVAVSVPRSWLERFCTLFEELVSE